VKKYLLLALLLLFIAAGAFAIDVGGGLFLSFGSREYWKEVRVFKQYSYGSGGYYDTDRVKTTLDCTNFGLHGFFGWKYFDFTLGFFYAGGYELLAFQVGYDVKIPITISEAFRIYPMLGFDSTFGDGFSYIGLKPHGGLGADYLIFNNMFLRANLLYCYNIEFYHETFQGSDFLIKIGVGWKF